MPSPSISFWQDVIRTFSVRSVTMNSEKKFIHSSDEEGQDGETVSASIESRGLLSQSPVMRTRRMVGPLLVSWPAFLIIVVLSVLCGALITSLVHLAHGVPQSSPSSPIESQNNNNSLVMVKPCGSTPEEARARGCHFDVISFCWLPEECYDHGLSADFDAENELEWFIDPEKMHPLSHEQIMTGEYTGLYVNWEYHLRHCTAMWKKMHRALTGPLGKAAIDSYIGRYPHTEHCEMMLLGNRSTAADVINTIILVKYPDCGIL